MLKLIPKMTTALPGPRLGDFLAGISVALIAIPQSLAYAELAGMPAYRGLYAVALPTLLAAFFVSLPYLQTGPVATTSLLTFAVLSHLAQTASSNYVALAALLAIIVGCIRILIGALKWGSVAYFLSQPVLLGFISAAAILIIASQLPTVLGATPSGDRVIVKAMWALVYPQTWNLYALLLGAITIALILGGQRLHVLFPGVLIAVALGMVCTRAFGYPVETIGDVPVGLPTVSVHLPWRVFPNLLLGGMIIAIIGFSEATSIAATFATIDRLSWNPNREFVSQGVANVVSGLSGGFPVGASFSRTAVNRLVGAQTQWSSAITGLVVVSLLPFTSILAVLPKVTLGAIVIASVVSLVRLRPLFKLHRSSRPQAYLGWVTFILTLALAPRIDVAVFIGVILAVAHHLRREQRLVYEHWIDADTLHFKPKGVLWFGSAPAVEDKLVSLLSDYPDIRVLQIHPDGLGRIDLSAAMMLDHFRTEVRKTGIAVELLNVPPMAKSWVERVW
ncbi:MAG: SulP family inorganic anion transporter [Candidatus Tectomicrobia bacterium]|nr:SulP family inorganic anion transporter [Candidatus Tectomicrobia bacterium]